MFYSPTTAGKLKEAREVNEMALQTKKYLETFSNRGDTVDLTKYQNFFATEAMTLKVLHDTMNAVIDIAESLLPKEEK